MKQVPTDGRVNWIVTAFAVVLFFLGFAFLFSGQWMGVTFFGRNDVEPLASILGAIYLGMGAMNWAARRSTLGGIYGRSTVVANQVHFFVGSMVLIRHVAAVGGPGMLMVLTVFYVVGAIYYCYLLFGRGVRPE